MNNYPHERVAAKKGWWCRQDWFSREDESACGFQYDSNNEKIFDSQVKLLLNNMIWFYNIYAGDMLLLSDRKFCL